MELRDSGIGEVRVDGDRITLRFRHAYILRSEGNPATGPATGWTQAAEFVFTSVAARAGVDGDGQIEFERLELDSGCIHAPRIH
jgi:hypothetical protein